MAAAPLIVYVTAPGFAADPGKFDLTVQMLRITFPYIVFISLVAFAAGVLNTWSRFAVPAITPALLNVAFIVGALFFADRLRSAGPGARLGGVRRRRAAAGLSGAVPGAKLGLLPRWRLDLSHPGVRRMLKLMAPAAFGVSISQISLLINTIFASFLVTGSVSWLYYADRLMEFPAGVLGVAVGTILLPSLSKYHAGCEPGGVRPPAGLGPARHGAARGARAPRRWRCSPCRSSPRCSITAGSPPRTPG